MVRRVRGCGRVVRLRFEEGRYSMYRRMGRRDGLEMSELRR